MTQQKTERNKLIRHDKLIMSWTKLILKWGFSYSTLRRIVNDGELECACGATVAHESDFCKDCI